MADPAIQRNPKESKVVVIWMAIDGGRWLPPHSVTRPGSLLMCNGNALFFRDQKRGANNVDVLHALTEMTMTRSKTWMILDKTRTNAGGTTCMMSNNGEWKENFRLSQRTPRLFSGGILFLVVETTNSLLTMSL